MKTAYRFFFYVLFIAGWIGLVAIFAYGVSEFIPRGNPFIETVLSLISLFLVLYPLRLKFKMMRRWGWVR